MKRYLLLLTALFLMLQMSFAEDTSNEEVELVSYSFIENKDLIDGLSLVVDSKNYSNLNITGVFRNWEYEYSRVEKVISSNTSVVFVNLSFEKPFQQFHDSFVLESVIINNKDFDINKRLLFNHLNRKTLGADISFSNLSYSPITGKLNLTINYDVYEGFDTISINARNLESNDLLFEEYLPINKGENTIIKDIDYNLTSFYVKADSYDDVLEYSELNNVAQYPFEKEEICGDGIDNDDDNLVDESCPNTCPDILPQKDMWSVVKCSDSNWSVEYFNNSPTIITQNSSNIIIAKSLEKNTSLFVNSTTPTTITTDFKEKQMCSGFPQTQQLITNNSDVFIYTQAINNSTISINTSN